MRKYFCHLGLLQRFPWKIIGWKNWIHKLLEAARTPNESNQNQNPNYQERRDLSVSNRSPRRLKKKSCLVAKVPKNSTRTERTRGWTKIHPELCVNACTSCRQRRRCRSNKNGGDPWVDNSPPSSRKLSIDWLHSTRIVTCSCERSRKFPRLRAREENRKVFLIKKHFKPTCSRTTSTTHSATIRRRWSVNWAM